MKEIILNFLVTDGMNVLITALLGGTILWLWKVGNKDIVNKIILELVCKAEKEFSGKTGTIKYAAVVSGLYSRLPVLARVLFTQEEIKEYIETACTWLKRELQSGVNLLSISEEETLKVLPKFSDPIATIEPVATKTLAVETIPVTDSISSDIDLVSTSEDQLQTVIPSAYERCGNCQGKFYQKCHDCDGNSNYMPEL